MTKAQCPRCLPRSTAVRLTAWLCQSFCLQDPSRFRSCLLPWSAQRKKLRLIICGWMPFPVSCCPWMQTPFVTSPVKISSTLETSLTCLHIRLTRRAWETFEPIWKESFWFDYYALKTLSWLDHQYQAVDHRRHLHQHPPLRWQSQTSSSS